MSKDQDQNNQPPNLSRLFANIVGVGATSVATQLPLTTISHIGAQMTSQQANLGKVVAQTASSGIPSIQSRMLAGLSRRTYTFGIPFPTIMFMSDRLAIQNPLFASVAAAALETAIASNPKTGSEVSERFGLVNGPKFPGIHGTLFRIQKEDFQKQYGILSKQTKVQCGEYNELEQLRLTARENKVTNITALGVRNLSFFLAVAAKSMVQKKVDAGEIDKSSQTHYEKGARLFASTMSVFPDALFTLTSSGKMRGADAIKQLPKIFVSQARNLPIIPRILSCYLSASASNYGFEIGSDLADLWSKGQSVLVSNLNQLPKDSDKSKSGSINAEPAKPSDGEVIEVDVAKIVKELNENMSYTNDKISPQNESEEKFLKTIKTLSAETPKVPSVSPSPKEIKKDIDDQSDNRSGRG